MTLWTLGWAAALVLCIAVFLLVENAAVVWIAIWLAAASLGALIFSVLPVPFVLQFIVFLLVLGIFLFLLKPSIRKRFPARVRATNADRVLGKYAPVTVAVDNVAGLGQIRVNGMEWTARSTDGQPIEEGAVVCVHHIEGVTAYVFPVVEDYTME